MLWDTHTDAWTHTRTHYIGQRHKKHNLLKLMFMYIVVTIAEWLLKIPEACLALFFYEILVAASVHCSSRIVEVASCYEISRARNFFATFC